MAVLMRMLLFIARSVLFASLMLALASSTAFSASQRDDVNYHYRNAKYYAARGKYDLALGSYNKAIQLSPNSVVLYYERASLAGKFGQYLQAIRDFSLVIGNAADKFPHATRFRGDCYMAVGHYQKAADDYASFLQGSPADGKVWSYKAEALSLYYRNDLALMAIEQGLKIESHWQKRLLELQRQILSGEKITPHKPLSN